MQDQHFLPKTILNANQDLFGMESQTEEIVIIGQMSKFRQKRSIVKPVEDKYTESPYYKCHKNVIIIIIYVKCKITFLMHLT